MKNDLCTNCDGRGFHWLKGQIVSHDGKTVLANTYKEGPTCDVCHGTGKRPASWRWLLQLGGCLGLAVLGLVALVGFMAITP